MNNKLKIKFKEGVYGFIFDSQYGEITDIITEPVTEQEQATFHKYSGDTLMFIDIETIQEVFSLEFEEDKDKVDSEFWNNVLEVVEENKIKPIEYINNYIILNESIKKVISIIILNIKFFMIKFIKSNFVKINHLN